MRLIYLLFITGCIPGTAPARSINMDNKLQQYSYYVFGKQLAADGKSMQTVEGSCFFVRVGEKVFLVSARHLMTGWNAADAKKEPLYPDTLFVRFAIPGEANVLDYPIDISVFKAGLSGSFYYNEPDLFVMEFIAADSIHVHTIDEIRLENFPADTGAAFSIYGFPTTNPYFLEGRLFSSPNQNIAYRDHKRNVDVSDTINYLLQSTGDVKPGFSGAPVFLKNDGTDKWYFGGIVSQGVPGENYFFVVKPGYLLKEIDQRLQ